MHQTIGAILPGSDSCPILASLFTKLKHLQKIEVADSNDELVGRVRLEDDRGRLSERSHTKRVHLKPYGA